MDNDTRQSLGTMRQEMAVALQGLAQQRQEQAATFNHNFAGMHEALGKIISSCNAMRDKLIELEVFSEEDVPAIGIEIKREVKRGVPGSKIITPEDNGTHRN